MRVDNNYELNSQILDDLFKHVYENQADKVRTLMPQIINRGLLVNTQENLIYAAKSGYIEVIKAILEESGQNNLGPKALISAIYSGRLDSVQYLFPKSNPDKIAGVALIHASQRGNYDILSYLLSVKQNDEDLNHCIRNLLFSNKNNNPAAQMVLGHLKIKNAKSIIHHALLHNNTNYIDFIFDNYDIDQSRDLIIKNNWDKGMSKGGGVDYFMSRYNAYKSKDKLSRELESIGYNKNLNLENNLEHTNEVSLKQNNSRKNKI